MHIGAEFEGKFVVVGRGDTGDKGGRAHGVGNAVWPGKVIKAGDGMSHEVFNEKSGKAFERDSMNARAKALLDGPDGAFHFTDVTVGGNDVGVNREEVRADAFEFMVAMEVGDGETSVGVCLEHGAKRGQDGVVMPVRHKGRSAVTKVPRDGVEKGYALNIKKIGA